MADSGYAGYAAAAADFGGGILTSALNVHETRQNRRFQTEMSDTAHQREVKDLQAAGLNPILSATGGSGASTPSGGVPQISDFSSPARTYSSAKAVSSQTDVNASQKASLDATTANTKAKTTTEQLLQYNSAQKMAADAALAMNEVYKSDAETTAPMLKLYQNNLRNQFMVGQNAATSSALQLSKQKAESDFYSGLGGKLAPWLGISSHALDAVQSVPSFYK